MILKSRYDKVMDYIEVTPAMHDRIMNRLCNEDFIQKESKVIPFKNYRKFASIAACFAVLFVSSILVYNSILGNNNVNISNQQPPVQIVSGVVEHPSIDKLSAAVGFEVYQVETLPFEAEQTQYASYWKKIAQIMYNGEGNTLAFRMSVGSEDNSGDPGEYSNKQTISIGDLIVTLKGEGEIYKLAIWQTEGYSYSINISNGISQEEMVQIIKSVPR
jgi:hypothetical protein